MIERTEERFGLKSERLVGDSAYGAVRMLNWLVEEKGSAPRTPVFDRSFYAKLATVFNHPQRPLLALFGPAGSP